MSSGWKKISTYVEDESSVPNELVLLVVRHVAHVPATRCAAWAATLR